jgi:hypothetical protein
MGGHGSGGHNRLQAEVHRIYRAASRRVATASGTIPPPAPLSAADRRRTLADLAPEGRCIAAGLLDAYDGCDAASLTMLRLFAESAARLMALADDVERRREMRTYLALLKSLELDR